jgi:hypothetical protein
MCNHSVASKMVKNQDAEELIVKLHNDGKNMREISKHDGVRKNFTFIGAVLRKRFPEEYADADTREELTKETQALKLFSKKKTPAQVAIKLEWDFEQTEKAYVDYWRLNRLFELYQIYCDHKDKLREILWFIRQLRKRRDINIKSFKDALKVLDNNKAFNDELEYFGKNVMPKFHNGILPET